MEKTEWSTTELLSEFTVKGFRSSSVSVIRKRDSMRGILQFRQSDYPRVYSGWVVEGFDRQDRVDH